MKQILFREKRKDNQEWVEGDLVHIENGCVIITSSILTIDDNLPQSNDLVYSSNEFTVVDPETVGQYTGVNDKNGKMIFEGDIMGRLFDDYNEDTIVVYHHGVLCAKPISKKYYRPLNIFNNCGWIPINEGSNYNFEIIGNIHDKPELIK